jgi:hypothetical protein
MNAWTRVFGTLFAAAAAGFLLWLAAQFNLHDTGGYWAAMGIVAGCGLILGIAQLRGAGGNPPAMLVFAFAPVFVCASWILLYAQPHLAWGRSQITSWSGHIGIGSAVHSMAQWNGVFAFGIGLVFAYMLEPRLVMHRHVEVTTIDTTAADEPVLAEREETAADASPTHVGPTATVR